MPWYISPFFLDKIIKSLYQLSAKKFEHLTSGIVPMFCMLVLIISTSSRAAHLENISQEIPLWFHRVWFTCYPIKFLISKTVEYIFYSFVSFSFVDLHTFYLPLINPWQEERDRIQKNMVSINDSLRSSEIHILFGTDKRDFLSKCSEQWFCLFLL